VPKILSKSGDSLADAYDVEGSIAGIEELLPRELGIIHEMGGTLFSERFSGAIRRITTGAIAQSTTFGVVIGPTDAGAAAAPISRINGIQVIADTIARVNLAAVLVRDPVTERELPLWAWDSSANDSITVRIQDDGAAVANEDLLRPAANSGLLPSILTQSGQPLRVSDLALRGQSNAFGAGTVTITALIYVSFADLGGVSSRGLPIPSW